MAVKVPIRTVFDGSTATGLAEYQSGEFIGLTHGGIGASLSIGSVGQVLKVNSGGSALEFGTATVAAAQTGITSILATDLIIGEDTQTAIDFGTTNEIDFKVDNAARLTLTSSVLFPVTDNQIDLGTSSLEFKDAFFDGTVTSDAFAGPLTGNVTGNADTATVATTVTITDNESTNENNAIIFTAGGDLDGGNLGLESDGDLKYNPSTGTLSATNISVSGTFSTVNSVTMDANNAVIFEGSTADAHETTLTSIDATGDRTISLPNVSGTLPVLAAASATAITSTPEELNKLDGATVVVGEINALDLGSTAVGTAIASKAVILDSNLDYTGIRNLTITGEIDAATGDYSGAVDVAGALTTVAITTTGVVDITDATDSSNDTGDTGALRTEGGASIAKKLFVGSAVDFSTTLQVDGVATFTARDIHSGGITIADAGQIGSASATNAMAISSGGIVTFIDDILLKDNCTIGTATTAGAIAIAADGTVDLDVAGATVASAVIKTVGKESIWVPASAMQPTTSNPCSDLTTVETTSGRPDMVVLDFDKDADEFAQFSIAFPKSYNLGTITFQVFWSGIAATTDCDWQLQGVAMNDNETIDIAYGTAVVVTDNAQGAVEELYVSAESGAVTIAGTVADNDLCYFRVGRDVSGDAMAGDARLHGLKIFFTTDSANDA